jgi:PAS domain S-box-containing protein
MSDFLLQLPGVIYELSIRPDGKRVFTFISPNCFEILGLKAEDVMQDTSLLTDIILPDDRESYDQSSKENYYRETMWSWEGRMMVRDEVRWMEARSNYQKKEDTVIRKGIILDITDRKLREQESEIRYQTLVEHLPLGVGVHVGGKLVFANRHAHEIMAAKPNELLGKSVLDFVHPDYREKVVERITRVLKGESLPMAEEKFIRSDGKEIDVETGAIPFTYRGQPANQIIVRDVTERKKAEAASKRNETLFTQLFNSIPMGVVMLNDVGKVEQVNQGFREMFGYDLDTLKGKNLNDFIVPDELRNEGIDFNNLITSNKVISVTTSRKHRDGHFINVLLYGVPVLLDHRTIGIYGVYVDITDRKKVEEELKIRNTELDNFVYKVSHDLRAPLSSILGLVNLARLPGNNDDPKDYINIIGKKVEDLDHFISDVLSHSKNLKLDLSITKVDFNSIISRTFTDLNYLDGASEMMVYRRVGGDAFYSDPWRISEIFRNLVSNAIKYRQIEATNPEIRIEVNASELSTEIIFADNGIGIDKESLCKIFEMFYRATEQSDGSGIGLYIVKNAVEKLGGSISVHSEPGVGTTFTIILPNRYAEVAAETPAHFAFQSNESN